MFPLPQQRHRVSIYRRFVFVAGFFRLCGFTRTPAVPPGDVESPQISVRTPAQHARAMFDTSTPPRRNPPQPASFSPFYRSNHGDQFEPKHLRLNPERSRLARFGPRGESESVVSAAPQSHLSRRAAAACRLATAAATSLKRSGAAGAAGRRAK